MTIATIHTQNKQKRKEETIMPKSSADEDVEKIEPFHIIGGNINYSVVMEIYVQVLK